MSDDLERGLPDVPAAFPRPDPALTEEVRGRVLGGTRPPRRRRLGLAAAAALLVIATVGFTIGHWLVPPRSAAATSISIAARPTVVTAYRDTVDLYGTVASGASGEDVSVEGKECGGYAGFHVVAGAQTVSGGAWLTKPTGVYLGITTTYRARWKNQLSDTVTVRVHPQLFLQKLNGFFQVIVRANDIFRGDVAVVERLRASRWIRVKPIVIKSFRGYAVGGMAHFRLSQSRGTSIRVVLPKAQAGRCYLAGFSNIVRV